MKAWTTGSLAGMGTFRCTSCEQSISLEGAEELPTCPNCGGNEFVRASLFTMATATAAHHVTLTAEEPPGPEDQGWRDEVRAHLGEPGDYIAFRDADDHVTAFALRREWTRIGRSLAADIRFDDPSVSRRHALIVRQPDGLRVLDDRSLNGVFVNGERVEWSPLADGDVIVVGRHQLHFVHITAVSGMRDFDAAGGLGSTASGR
jgi:predicted  nucleic acid-binding Zn-ribbon protein